MEAIKCLPEQMILDIQPSRKRRSRKIFFQRVWERMHNENDFVDSSSISFPSHDDAKSTATASVVDEPIEETSISAASHRKSPYDATTSDDDSDREGYESDDLQPLSFALKKMKYTKREVVDDCFDDLTDYDIDDYMHYDTDDDLSTQVSSTTTIEDNPVMMTVKKKVYEYPFMWA